MNKSITKRDVLVAMAAATKAELTATVETQTLLQLLVKKGILSREEVDITREEVFKNDSRVRSLVDMLDLQMSLCDEYSKIDKIVKDNPDKTRFMYLRGKMIHDKDSMTEDEIDYLDSKLDFKKYWEDKK